MGSSPREGAEGPVRRDTVGRLHALLRRALPRSFRRAHGEEMERVFRERVRDERGRGTWRVGVVWAREWLDLVETGVRLRMSWWGKGVGSMDEWMDDVKSALRSVRRSPGFATFAVGTLGLGVGATITFAAFLEGVVLRPVDFPDAGRVVMAWRTQDSGFMVSPDLPVRDRMRTADVFAGVAAVEWREVARSTDDGPEILSAGLIDGALPRLAGLPPLLGRYFEPADLAGAGAPVALLSEGYWKRAFGAHRDILGRTVTLEGEPRTVVGVAPEALRAPGPGHPPIDVWLPLPADGAQSGVNVFARLREGVTLEQAQERVRALDLAAAENEASPWRTRLVPVSEFASARLRNALKAVGAAVALLLLIACINVANLLLARGDARRRETAVRAALGAGRLRLGRELLLESALVSMGASAVGLGLATGALGLVHRLRPEDLQLLDRARLDPTVTLAAVGVAIGTALAFGVIPVLSRVRTRPGVVLSQRRGTADGDSVGLRRLLLAGEIALSFALLAGAIQIAAELDRVRSRDPGLAVDELLGVSVRLPEWRFAEDADREDALVRIRRSLQGLPGVEAVTVASGAPPAAGIFFGEASAEGQPPTEDAGKAVPMFGNSVEPGYFSTVGQAVLEGRGFTEEDLRADPRPVLLGESAARKYFPDGGAVGGHFRLGAGDAWRPVIGVVRDVWATGSATDPGYPQLYMLRDEGSARMVVVRTADPAAVAGMVRAAVRAVDPEIPVVEMRTVASRYGEALARERLIGALLAAFAATAAALAAVGLYGVAAQLAVRRVREFGIRISLGAERRSIFALALRGGATTLLLGLLAGTALAWAGLRFLRAGVAGLDGAHPYAFLAAMLLLAAATLIATGLPAARAARTDPVEAMRAD
jgi:putative ABC transport system permease protein